MMSSDQPAVIDLTLTDPTAVVHAVADHLAGRWVDLAWATLDGVWRGTCRHARLLVVAGRRRHRSSPWAYPPTTTETIEVQRRAGTRFSASERRPRRPSRPSDLLDRIATVSRWFGHQMAIIQRDRHSIVGTVIGFDLLLRRRGRRHPRSG